VSCVDALTSFVDAQQTVSNDGSEHFIGVEVTKLLGETVSQVAAHKRNLMDRLSRLRESSLTPVSALENDVSGCTRERHPLNSPDLWPIGYRREHNSNVERE
jgi:hypothetical protein